MPKILLIDDEKIIRERLGRLLELEGYEAFTADSGQNGLDIFRKEKPEVLLTDIKMPGMDGIEVLSKVKSEARQTEVILLTGHGGVDTAIEALKGGAFSYFQKPVDFDALSLDIRKALDKQRLQRQLDEHVIDLERTIKEKEKEIGRRMDAEDALLVSVGIERFISSVSTRFNRVEIDNLEDEITKTLQDIASFLKMEHCFFFVCDQNKTKIDMGFHWCALDTKPFYEHFCGSLGQYFPWIQKNLLGSRAVHIPKVGELTSEAHTDKEKLLSLKIKSLLVNPLQLGEEISGGIGGNTCNESREWSDDEIWLLDILGGMLLNAIKRKKSVEQLNQQQDQLVQADKMSSIGVLAAGVAHEINNPLNVALGDLHLFTRDIDYFLQFFIGLSKLPYTPEMQGHLKTLEEKYEFPTLIQGMLEKLPRFSNSLKRIESIVERLRMFTHLDQEAINQVDINSSIEDSIEMVALGEKKNITIVKYFSYLPPIISYGRGLNHVFMNLIMNACQSMGEEGTLTIKTYVEQERIVILFSDIGPGIPPGKISHLFEPFYTTKEVGSGSGLGLSICYGIIKRLNGTLSVKNNKDKGATFTIELNQDQPV